VKKYSYSIVLIVLIILRNDASIIGMEMETVFAVASITSIFDLISNQK